MIKAGRPQAMDLVLGSCYCILPWAWKTITQPWKWPNPVRKVQLHIQEDTGRKVTGSKLSASKDSSQFNLCLNVPFLLWFVHTIAMHVWDVLAECTFALHLRDVTWAQWIKDPPGWWQPLKLNYNSIKPNSSLSSLWLKVRLKFVKDAKKLPNFSFWIVIKIWPSSDWRFNENANFYRLRLKICSHESRDLDKCTKELFSLRQACPTYY